MIKRFIKFLLFVCVFVLVAGLVTLSFWTAPTPSKIIEKEISHVR